MRKRFRSRRRKNKVKTIKIIVFIIIIILMYQFISILLSKIKLSVTNEEYIKLLINDSNHHILNNDYNLINRLGDNLLNAEIVRPINMLEKIYNYPIETASDLDVLVEKSEYINDPNPVDIDNPRVYIYNTHQSEGYDKAKLEEHNIKPSVMMASYILREKLNKIKIPTIVETGDITTLLNSNGWDYSYSYQASRYFVEEILKKYDNLDLIIDIHRDAISKKSSTAEIDGKKYAKILFVIGAEHENYKENLKVATKINNIIKKKYPEISRGIMEKSGKNVNGIYNQDLNANIILIECGGYKNTIDEVNNTLDIISEAIKEYLEEI